MDSRFCELFDRHPSHHPFAHCMTKGAVRFEQMIAKMKGIMLNIWHYWHFSASKMASAVLSD
jgi:hypothetical protein